MRNWRSNIILIVSGFVTGAILCEIGMRLLGISYPEFYQYDQDVGVFHRPGAEGVWNKEGEEYVLINSEGLRDREHVPLKPDHTLRIAVVGDSYAEALQVPMEDAFWTILGREAAGCPALVGREPEVINFGVSGFGTAQELMTIRHRVWSYHPDIVLLAFVTGNDIRNNSRILEQDDFRPYYVFRDGKLVPDLMFRESWGFRLRNGPLGSWLYWVRAHSRVMQLLAEARAHFTTAPSWNMHPSRTGGSGENVAEKEDVASGKAGWAGYLEPGLDPMVYVEPHDPAWKEAWQVTEALLVLMRDEVKEQGADLLVVTLSNAIQVHPNPAVRRTFAEHLGIPHLFYPDVRIQELGERTGIGVFNLAPLFQTYAEQRGVFLHGFENASLGRGHWNREGHRLAGRLIAEKLCADITHRQDHAGQRSKGADHSRLPPLRFALGGP